jgi:hypothetical protein
MQRLVPGTVCVRCVASMPRMAVRYAHAHAAAAEEPSDPDPAPSRPRDPYRFPQSGRGGGPPDPFEVLGLDRSADEAQIKRQCE